MLESQHSFLKGGEKRKRVDLCSSRTKEKAWKKRISADLAITGQMKRGFFPPPWHQTVLQTIILFLSLSLTVFEFWVLANLSSSCSFLKAGKISRVISKRNSNFIFACAAFPSGPAAHSCPWSAQHREPFEQLQEPRKPQWEMEGQEFVLTQVCDSHEVRSSSCCCHWPHNFK